jgi:prepilin-type processing-associated H-X9-DG protein
MKTMQRKARQVRCRAFSLVELLVIIGLILLLIAVLAPALSKGRAQAWGIRCSGNLRQIGSLLDSYTTSSHGQLPAVSFDEVYGDAHPVSGIYEAGGTKQMLLPDALLQPTDTAGMFTCPALGFSAERVAPGQKFVTAGSYAYMCGHAHQLGGLNSDSSPLRALLALYGPKGILHQGDGRDILDPEEFFACGRRLQDMQRPSDVPVAFHDGFGGHGSPLKWERQVLPKELGGVGGGRGGTVVLFADGHVETAGGTIEELLPAIGMIPRQSGATTAAATNASHQ